MIDSGSELLPPEHTGVKISVVQIGSGKIVAKLFVRVLENS
jgi:hypothetical protein